MEYVEAVGRWWEATSGSRVGGRILGWLQICEPVHQSSADLAEKLSISTGSVSTQVRTLEFIGLVERVTFPGDRATYFQFRRNAWNELMWEEKQRLEEMMALTALAAKVLPEERPERVTHLRLVARFFLDEWPALMKRLNDYMEKESGDE